MTGCGNNVALPNSGSIVNQSNKVVVSLSALTRCPEAPFNISPNRGSDKNDLSLDLPPVNIQDHRNIQAIPEAATFCANPQKNKASSPGHARNNAV